MEAFHYLQIEAQILLNDTESLASGMVLVYSLSSTMSHSLEFYILQSHGTTAVAPEDMICLMFVTLYRFGEKERNVKGPFRESIVEIKNIPKCLIWKQNKSRNTLAYLPALTGLSKLAVNNTSHVE